MSTEKAGRRKAIFQTERAKKVREFQVTQKDMPRLDRFLLGRIPALSPGNLHKYLRQNKIKVDGKKMPLSTRLAPGSIVRLYLPDDLFPAVDAPLWMQAKPFLTVLYENEDLLAVDKPAGLLSLDETGRTADTLENRALSYLARRGMNIPESGFRPCLCHRLDTGTSGILLVAKTQKIYTALCDLIRERRIQKEYLCVTLGRPFPADATLMGYLVKDAQHGIVKILSHPAAHSREVITRYETLAVSGRLALLQVQLVTGRTHQIRAHMASIGCPILGDSKYGNNNANRELHFKYQALCAVSLQFPQLEPDAPCSALSGMKIETAKPWYVQQILNGTLR